MSEEQAVYNVGVSYKDFNDFAQSKLTQMGNNCINSYSVVIKSSKEDFLEQIKYSSDYDIKRFLLICFRFLLAENKPLDFIINTCMSILDSKKHDYSKSDNRYSNFEFTQEYAKDYVSSTEGIFVVMLGIKVARLIELIGNDKTPNNESILDSVIDLMNYRLLREGFKMGLKI